MACDWSMSEFKYFGCALDESGRDKAEYHRKVVSGRRVQGANRSLVIVRGLQHEYARVLHETFLMPVFIYGSEAML